MPETTRRLFFDTVALSNFALAGRLEVLVARYGVCLQITNEVLDEISDGVAAGHGALAGILALAAAGAVSVTGLETAERELYVELLRTLGPGEASCIAAAASRKGVVVSDDRAARAGCTECNVPFTGTIGILKACCRDGVLSADTADEILAAMIAQGFYSPVQRLSHLL